MAPKNPDNRPHFSSGCYRKGGFVEGVAFSFHCVVCKVVFNVVFHVVVVYVVVVYVVVVYVVFVFILHTNT